jgi:hypothetical protein
MKNNAQPIADCDHSHWSGASDCYCCCGELRCERCMLFADIIEPEHDR